MRIDFLEEYPLEAANLAPAALWPHAARVYLATRRYDDFRACAQRLVSVNPLMQAAWWPLLGQSYWFSPWSHPQELADFIDVLDRERTGAQDRLAVLIDLELPTLRPTLLLRHLAGHRRARALLTEIFQRAPDWNIELATAEYPAFGGLNRRVWERLGISLDRRWPVRRRYIMYYPTLIPRVFHCAVRRHIGREARAGGDSYALALGPIARGALGNEVLRSPGDLAGDLAFARRCGIEGVGIFRLGGLNPEFLRQLAPHA